MRIACGALIALALGLGAWMWWESRKAIRMLRTFRVALADVPPLEKTERRRGLPLTAVEALRARCDELPTEVKNMWDDIDQHVEPYTSPEGAEGWFLTLAPRAVLTEEAGRRPVLSRLVPSSSARDLDRKWALAHVRLDSPRFG
jgi:hypothetical protein